MEKCWDILGIGAVTIDDFLYLDHYPQINEKLPVQMKKRQGGGLTATALVTASRQGARSAYCGRLGDDDLSISCKKDLESEGVDISPVQHSGAARPFHSIILVDIPSGSRVIIFDPEGVEEPDISIVNEDLITRCRYLFIDNTAYKSGLLAASFARSNNIPVVADLESIKLPDVHRFLDAVDHLIIGIETARALTHKETVEDMVRDLSNPQKANCVVTDGVNGCWYSEFGGIVQHVPAYRVDVVDTTGCGDVFHGAYTAALARGESIGKSIKVASASAAIKARCCGGREGIPDLVSVEKFLIENG